jgi:hypothetical protein
MTSWGSGSTGIGEDVSLECGSCHNPHGNPNYRILKGKPSALSGYASLTAVNITVGTSDNYTITYDGSYYRDLSQYTTGVTANMSDWCGQCHTRYHAGSGSATSANVTPFEYRHYTDGLSGECLKCHVVHGTTASMTGYSDDPTWPGGNATAGWQTGTEGEASRLLHIDERGVCIQCHTDLGG